MKRTAILTALAVGAACLALPTAAHAQWGNFKGRFVYDGEPPVAEVVQANKNPEVCGKTKKYDESLVVGENGGIRYVVVYLQTKNPKVHPDYAAEAAKIVQIDNKDCRFEPHVLPIVITQTLEILNSDPEISHNSNLTPLNDKHINPNIPSGQKETYKFSRLQNVPTPVTCNIHPWMKGYIIPRDNPYVVVTDADGAFEIKNLPVGKHEFRAWHERPGYLEAKSDWKRGVFKFEIKEGDNDLGEIKVAPKSLEPKKGPAK